MIKIPHRFSDIFSLAFYAAYIRTKNMTSNNHEPKPAQPFSKQGQTSDQSVQPNSLSQPQPKQAQASIQTNKPKPLPQAAKAKPIHRMPPAMEIQQLRQKLQRLELAMEISRQFSATLDVDKLMQTILDKVAHVTNAEAGSFWIKEKQSNNAICHVACGPVQDKVLGLKLKQGTGIVGWVIENKQKTVVFDTTLDDRFFNKVDEKVKFTTKSMLCVPLLVNNECVGAISLLNKKTPQGQFNQQDVEMLELLAMSGAIAIKNAQLFQSERKIKELRTLLTISREISSTLDLDRVLLAIVNLGSQVIDYKRAIIGLLDFNNKLTLSAETNVAEPDMTESQNKQIKAIMKYVLDSEKPIHVVNFQKDKPPKNIPKDVINYLDTFELKCISVMIMADAEGQLAVISMEGTYHSLVSKESTDVIDIVVNQATVAIRNAQLYKSLPSKTLTGKLKSSVKESGRSWKKRIIFLIVLALLIVLMNIVTMKERVTGVVEVIPSHIMKVTAMTDGVVQSVDFNEGDLVKSNQKIIALDSSLLELERQKIIKDINIQTGELRRLQSEGNPFEVHLKQLEIEKLNHQFQSINKQLSFTTITPLTDGRVLTQQTGQLINKQVMKGEILTEIAVNDSKMIEVLLAEPDVLKVKPGHQAYITLQAFPDFLIHGQVQSVSWTITEPETEDEPIGYKTWIVAKNIDKHPDIRFGMTGRAKILTGKKTIYEIYFKPFFDRIITEFRLKFSLPYESESGNNPS
jgi:GAF domain-containing protein/multidrug resistance efflux pump